MSECATRRLRLDSEQRLLAKRLPGFRFRDLEERRSVLGWAQTSSGRRYRLKVELGADFPHIRPTLRVFSPRTLPLRDQHQTLNALGPSHRFHTSGSSNGRVQIDYGGVWHTGMTCAVVILRGYIWLEAYEFYLRTGRFPCESLA